MSYKSEIFKDVLDAFEVEEMKLFCIDLLENRDEINYSIPSSTSYKYHNKTQCQPGGQILHELMVATMMNYLLGLEFIQNSIKHPRQRDCMRIAAIMHDCMKTNGGQYTVHEHPMLGSKFVEECEVEHPIKPELRKYIGRLIQSHSGQWVDSKRSSLVLPKPETTEQFFVHLCDYFSSRANIDMIYTPEVLALVNENLPEAEKPDPDTWTFTFGKYKGLTFNDILKEDKQYLLWLRDKSSMDIREPLASFLKTI